jgi:hypothetical protein
MKTLEVASTIISCSEFFTERYGNMTFNCWLCKKTVSKKCGGIDCIAETAKNYLAENVVEQVTPLEIEIAEPTEQLSFF